MFPFESTDFTDFIDYSRGPKGLAPPRNALALQLNYLRNNSPIPDKWDKCIHEFTNPHKGDKSHERGVRTYMHYTKRYVYLDCDEVKNISMEEETCMTGRYKCSNIMKTEHGLNYRNCTMVSQ